MDLNLEVIRAVRNCPTLYKTNAVSAARQQTWVKLANKLKMEDRFLMSRWYMLRERFLEDKDNFKYRTEMNFLLPHLQLPIAAASQDQETQLVDGNTIISPEFVITDKDIEEMSDESECQQFIYLDEDEDDDDMSESQQNQTECLDDSSQQEQTHEEQIIEIDDTAEMIVDHHAEIIVEHQDGNQVEENEDDNLEEEHQDDSELAEQQDDSQVAEHQDDSQAAEHQDDSQVEVIELQEIQQNADNAEQQEGTRMHISDIEEEAAIEHTSKFEVKQEKIKENQKEADRTPIKNNVTDGEKDKKKGNIRSTRCEDEVFGELVTVMIKRMDDEKKRGVKREIMNLLLS